MVWLPSAKRKSDKAGVVRADGLAETRPGQEWGVHIPYHRPGIARNALPTTKGGRCIPLIRYPLYHPGLSLMQASASDSAACTQNRGAGAPCSRGQWTLTGTGVTSSRSWPLHTQPTETAGNQSKLLPTCSLSRKKTRSQRDGDVTF